MVTLLDTIALRHHQPPYALVVANASCHLATLSRPPSLSPILSLLLLRLLLLLYYCRFVIHMKETTP